VNLVNDIHLVLTLLRPEPHLFIQRPDMLHAIVRSGIKLNDVEGCILLERFARLAFTARVYPIGDVFAVECPCENSGAGRFAHTTRPTEEESMSKVIGTKGSLQRTGDMPLAYDL